MTQKIMANTRFKVTETTIFGTDTNLKPVCDFPLIYILSGAVSEISRSIGQISAIYRGVGASR